jgi:MurNAc alpha-1-phosphate uridylyltransferase
MKAFLLAAGFGKRMRELSENLPKPMLPICNVPLLAYSLFLCKKWGIEEVIINTHHLAGKIHDYCMNFEDFPLRIHHEKDKILGTAGGIATAIQKYWKAGDTDFIILNPDSILIPDQEFQLKPQSKEFYGKLYMSPIPEGKTFTSFERNDDGNWSLSNQGKHYYMGLSLFNSSVFKNFPIDEDIDLSPYLKDWIQSKKIEGEEFQGEVIDVGEKDMYLKNKDLKIEYYFGEEWNQFLKRNFNSNSL